MAGRLQGKVAIVTGASRGLGEYVSVGYGREGAKVVIAARTEEEKDPRLPGTIYHTAKLVEEAGGEALPVVCDVSSMESVEAMVETVMKKWGQIDVLMTNAAVQPAGLMTPARPDFPPIKLKSWELEFNINVHGPFRTIRAAIPHMIEKKSGSIINISSVAARGGSHYGATKRAIEAMTIGMANECKDVGIAVNALKPVGGIETPGLLFGRAPGTRGTSTAPRPGLPKPDSYVEAAVLLALATPDKFTGQVHNDAEIINLLADQKSKERFRKENPENWVAAMGA